MTSVPPPGRPVGDLKKLDGRRVAARLIDAVVVGVPSWLAATAKDDGAYFIFLALTLIYFFVCEATMAQTVGKRAMGLRVMTRDGAAPTVNAISVRTVLRLIDDGPIGLIVMVCTGKRRQRIGDLLAGTAVGQAVGPVPRPGSSPLLAIYPAAWLIGAMAYITLPLMAGPEAEYVERAQAICLEARELPAADVSVVLPVLVEIHAAHAALSPPAELAGVHAELLRAERASVELGRRMIAARDAGDRRRLQTLLDREAASLARRDRIVGPHLPECATPDTIASGAPPRPTS